MIASSLLAGRFSAVVVAILFGSAAVLLPAHGAEGGKAKSKEKKKAKAEEAVVKMAQALADGYVKDPAVVEKILSDDYVFILDDGTVRTKQDEVGALKSGVLKITELKPEDVRVRVYGKTGVLTATYLLKGTADGHDLSGKYKCTDVFVRKKKDWRLVSSQTSRMKP